MFLLYARVSTRKQQKHGNLKHQVYLLKHYAKKAGHGDDYRVYAEAYTGKTNNRPKFNLLKNSIRKGDTVVLARIDRFSRNFRQAVDDLDDMRKAGVRVVTLLPFFMDLNKASSNQVYSMLNFADMERKAIITRTRNGKIFALAHGKKSAIGGRPTRSRNKEHYQAMSNYTVNHTVGYTAKVFGCSKRTVYYAKEEFAPKKASA